MLKTLGDKLHAAFEVSLVFKGLFAAAEILAGIFAWLVPPQFLLDIVRIVTRTELAEDPNDPIANRLLSAAQGLSISGQHFAAIYLLSHGILKLWLIIGLWRGKLAYYPVTLVVFGLFIVYQLYRYSHTHSPMLLVLTIVDVLVIWLTLTEYRRLRLARQAA